MKGLLTFRSGGWRRWLAGLLVLSWLVSEGAAEPLVVNDDVQTVMMLVDTEVTLSGRGELVVIGTGDPLPGSTVNFVSVDAWLRFPGLLPSEVRSNLLGRFRVNGVAAVLDGNVRIVQYERGAVVIPQPPDFPAMEVFDARYFAGRGKRLYQYVAYNDVRLGAMRSAVRSFRLKRGYMATLAANEDGTGVSRVYVAQDGDLEVGRLPDGLEGGVRFVRIFPWRWVSKKGFAGTIGGQVRPAWFYNWNLDQVSSLDREYVAIRQNRWWPELDQDWKARGINHLLGYNEPDHAQQANMTVAEAIAGWPDLLATGLRVGAPAITDGGKAWLTSFMGQAAAAGLRVDFVPVHYYRSYSSASDPAGAAAQFYNFLKDIHDAVDRPLWVTEFNNGANWTSGPDPTAAQQAATMGKMVEMLDSTPFVERYAVYNWVEDVRRVVWDDGWPTAAGLVYRDQVSPLSWRQEMADAGTGNSARYDFDGNVRDTWGNGQDAMMVGVPMFAAGKSLQCVVLDGEDYLQLSPRIGDTSGFTFAAWVWWNGGSNWQRIFDFGADTSNYLAMTPKAGASGGLRFMMRNGGAEQVLNAAALTANVWTHVAVTVGGGTGKLFVNGVLVNTNNAMSIQPVSVGTKFNYLGRSQFPADPLFNGRLDDVRIVSSAVSDAAIAAMVATVPPRFGTTVLTKSGAVRRQVFTGTLAGDARGGSGVLTFSKMSGPAWLAVARDGRLTGVPGYGDVGMNRFSVRVTDGAGALHTAELRVPVVDAEGTWWRFGFDGNVSAACGPLSGVASGNPGYVSGRSGLAIDLDGVDDFVTLPGGIADAAELTLAVWMQWDGGGAWQRVYDFGNSGSESMFLTPKSGASTMQFTVRNREDGGTLEAPMPVAGQWTHVAVTMGGGTGRLYVNGVLADSGPMPVDPVSFGPATNYVGKSQYADPNFNGRLDDLVMLGYAMNAAQVAALMNGRAPGFVTDPFTRPTAVPGVAYNQSLAGSAFDPNPGTELRFTKVSGPAWLTVGADGRISGMPGAADAGVNRFVVRATDPTQLADDAVLNIAVQRPEELVAHYGFDGTGANHAGGSAAGFAGGPMFGEGIFDRAVVLDGVDDRVTLAAGAAAGLSDATFAVRVRWDGGAAWQRVFDFGSGAGDFLMLSPASDGGTPQFAIRSAGGTTQRISGPAALTAGEWAHLAVTLMGNTGTLYVNGAAVATAAITLDPSAVTQSQCWLGASQTAGDPLLAGAIDDFRIYRRGLSADEVGALAIPVPAVAVPLDYAGWVTGYGFGSGQGGAVADPDGDGVANVFEYLGGTHPLVAGNGVVAEGLLRSGAELGLSGAAAAQRYLCCRARVRRERPGLVLTAEGSDGLGGFSAASAAVAGAGVVEGEYEVLTWYHRTEVGAGARGQLRLRAVLP